MSLTQESEECNRLKESISHKEMIVNTLTTKFNQMIMEQMEKEHKDPLNSNNIANSSVNLSQFKQCLKCEEFQIE